MKKWLIILIIIISFGLLSGCENESLNPMRTYRPDSIPGSVWEEENGGMLFINTERWDTVGIFVTNQAITPCVILMHHHMPMLNFNIFPLESFNWLDGHVDQEEYSYMEEWNAGFNADNEFSAVVEHTTFFEPGDKKIFFRTSFVAEKTSESESQLWNLIGSVWEMDGENHIIVSEDKKLYAFLTIFEERLYFIVEQIEGTNDFRLSKMQLSDDGTSIEAVELPDENWKVFLNGNGDVEVTVEASNFYEEKTSLLFHRLTEMLV